MWRQDKMGQSTFLSSLLDIALAETVNVIDGFIYKPLTKIVKGSTFSNSKKPVNYTDSDGNYQVGQPYANDSPLASASHTEATPYTPGDTTPPREYPTTQTNYTVPLGTNPAQMYKMSAEGRRMLKTWEGLHQRPYTIGDQRYIGYGHKIGKDDKTTYISLDQANSYLDGDISSAEGMVKGAISRPITQGQFDAMVDFAYTVDGGKFKGSEVVSKMNGGDVSGACTALMQWVYALQNNILVQIPHLVSRRNNNTHWMTAPADPRAPTEETDDAGTDYGEDS
jgi:lysozyme